ncbi:MAG: alpha amylase [Lachnospiraceae bacterium]|nr:alpha amylase [Lachnospiraceae bacterium]
MKRKIVVLLLCFAMLCTCFGGCRQEEKIQLIDDEYRNFYQIFPGSYYDSNGDGSGDLQGIIQKLDYIEEMGFNGIWMTPIMPSPTYHKYDVTNYYEIDPAFGTIEDYEALVEACHERGIRLIVDLVLNHTSNKHPWFTEAVAYLETLEEGQEPDLTACPYVGYYYFAKEGAQGVNWHKAGNSDFYYEGVFVSEMPDLNLENQAVRKEFEDIIKFWLDMGTDGFRLDAAKEYFTGYAAKNTEVLKWITDYTKSVNEEAYLVAEVWERGQSTLVEYYASGIDSLFNFPAATQEGAVMKTARNRVDVSEYVTWMINQRSQDLEKNPNYIDAPFVSNHDTTRISAQSVSDEGVMKFAAGLLLTMPGSPFVYYGEEIGMKSKGDLDQNKRLPMYWSATNTEGITEPPKGAESVEQKFPALDEQMEDETSIYHYYKNALKVRNSYPEIARGDVTKVEGTFPQGTAAVLRQWGEESCVVVYCNAEEGTTLDLAAAGLSEYEMKASLTVGEDAVVIENNEMKLPFGSIVIMK